MYILLWRIFSEIALLYTMYCSLLLYSSKLFFCNFCQNSLIFICTINEILLFNKFVQVDWVKIKCVLFFTPNKKARYENFKFVDEVNIRQINSFLVKEKKQLSCGVKIFFYWFDSKKSFIYQPDCSKLPRYLIFVGDWLNSSAKYLSM